MKRLLLVAVFLLPQAARPDAIVVTKAMTASTIAEIYITEAMVRVELEIGVTDWNATVGPTEADAEGPPACPRIVAGSA